MENRDGMPSVKITVSRDQGTLEPAIQERNHFFHLDKKALRNIRAKPKNVLGILEVSDRRTYRDTREDLIWGARLTVQELPELKFRLGVKKVASNDINKEVRKLHRLHRTEAGNPDAKSLAASGRPVIVSYHGNGMLEYSPMQKGEVFLRTQNFPPAASTAIGFVSLKLGGKASGEILMSPLALLMAVGKPRKFSLTLGASGMTFAIEGHKQWKAWDESYRVYKPLLGDFFVTLTSDGTSLGVQHQRSEALLAFLDQLSKDADRMAEGLEKTLRGPSGALGRRLPKRLVKGLRNEVAKPYHEVIGPLAELLRSQKINLSDAQLGVMTRGEAPLLAGA